MYKLSSGQALLLILLIMSVALTVVLSVASRSITEVKISSTEEDSLRAFNAAEAGVEEALLVRTVGTFTSGDALTPTPLPGGGSYVAVASENTPPGEFTYPNVIKSGEVATFWFVSHADDGQLTCNSEPCFGGNGAGNNVIDFCWGDAGAPDPKPAIEVLFFYDDDTVNRFAVSATNDYMNVKVKRFAWDPDPASQALNGFDSPNSQPSTNCPESFEYNSRINVPSVFNPACRDTRGCLLLAKVRAYNNTEDQAFGIALNPNGVLPAQGIEIASSGTSGESKRNLNVFQGYAVASSPFDSALFSTVDLDHVVY